MRTIHLVDALRLAAFLEDESPGLAALPPVAALAAASGPFVPEALFFTAWEAAVRWLDDPGLPVRFGAGQTVGATGPLRAVIRAAPRCADVLEAALHHQRLRSSSGQFEQQLDRRGLSLTWHREGRRALGLRVANEAVLAEVVALVREVAGYRRPLSVHFRHPPPGDVTAHRRFFDCPVVWRAVRDAVVWHPEVLDAAPRPVVPPGPGGDLSRLPRAPADLTDEVRLAIARLLPTGAASLDRVARRMALSGRTLRRRLAERQLTFRDLVTEVRRVQAEDLLAQDRPVGDVARELGFSQTSALSRSYRRWFGASPRRRRR